MLEINPEEIATKIHIHQDHIVTTMKIDDKLSEVFDVEVYVEHDVIKPDGEVIPPDNNECESDYQKVRNNLHTILEYGNKGIDFAFQVARQTEDPKAIGAFTDLLKAVTESNMKLIEIHERKTKVKIKEPDATTGQIVQNNQQNVFLGTTADLSKFIKEMNNK